MTQTHTPIRPDVAAATIAPSGAVCQGCQYSLATLPAGKCPECGKQFDPDDPDSIGPKNLRVLRPLAGFAPPWVFIWFMVAPLAIILCVASPPDRYVADEWTVALYMFLPFVWVLVFLLPLALHLIARGWMRLLGEPRPARQWRWAVPLVAIVAFYWLHAEGAVFWCRWYFAQDGFAALAQAPASTWTPRRIGTFNIESVRIDPDGTAHCVLGFPDCYSDGHACVERGPGAPTFGPCDQDLGNGWFVVWDPT